MNSETSETAVFSDAAADPVDSEGLYAQYDVVICGTGLVQSILASAIARYASGKKMLHVDGSDHYGNLDAVWTLPYLFSEEKHGGQSHSPESAIPISYPELSSSEISQIPLHPMGELSSLRFHSMQRHSAHGLIQIRKPLETPYGRGRIRALRPIAEDTCTLEMELTSWTLANGTFPALYIRIPLTEVSKGKDGWSIDGNYLWNHYRIRTVTAHRAAQILDQYSRSLALDVTPYLLYASGPAVDGLLLSTVSNYLEFKSLEAVLYYTSSPQAQLSSQSTTRCGTFTRVPCSKNDVFASQLLSPMDKRRLMKFLHLALDYASATTNPTSLGGEHRIDEHSIPDVATVSVTDDLLSLNERHLNQGRSLMRPQNKAVASTELQHLQDACRASSAPTSFVSYLRDDQKLSPPLVALIRYALALDTNCDAASDDETMDHGTPVAMGMEQLCAHMLALGQFGTTAFLVPLYGSGELSQAFCRSAAVYGATYLLRRAPTAILWSGQKVSGIHLSRPIEDESTLPLSCASSKPISCAHVVIPYSSIRHADSVSPRTVQRVLRRISILTGKPIQIEKDDNQQQRHVLIIPPHSISKQQKSTIHGVVVDEFVNVAPHLPGGCTILHLTTTIDSTDETVLNDSLLAEAFDVILDCFRSAEGEEIAEIFHVSFSYDVAAPPKNETNISMDCLPKSEGGLHLVHRPRPGLTADDAFLQAAAIFQQIFPQSTPDDFLSLSQATTEAIKASLGENALNNDDDDEETMALTSAVEMIGKPHSDTPTKRDEDMSSLQNANHDSVG
jgi:Rab proteins geranylgeranyltransferase component A